MTLVGLPQYTNTETFNDLLDDLYGHWWALHVDYPYLEDTLLDELAAKEELEKILRLDEMTDKEYRQRIRAVIVMHIQTLGEKVALKLIDDHPVTSLLAATYTLDVAARLESFDTPYALPCFLNTVSNLSIHVRPSDPDQGMRDVMTYLEIGQEGQDSVMKSFSVVAPVIH